MSEAITAVAAPEECAPDWLRWVTRVSIVFGIGGIVVTTWIVGVDVIFDHLRAIGWWFLVLVGVEMIATNCDATAVYLMTRGTGAPSFRDVIVAQFAGRAVNSVTPASNLGEALKVSLLARNCSPAGHRGRSSMSTVMLVMSLSVIAIGSVATAFLFNMPDLARCACARGRARLSGRCCHGRRADPSRYVGTLTAFLARIHIISNERQERWNERLADLDSAAPRRRRGGAPRRRDRVHRHLAAPPERAAYLTIFAAGYPLGRDNFSRCSRPVCSRLD